MDPNHLLSGVILQVVIKNFPVLTYPHSIHGIWHIYLHDWLIFMDFMAIHGWFLGTKKMMILRTFRKHRSNAPQVDFGPGGDRFLWIFFAWNQGLFDDTPATKVAIGNCGKPRSTPFINRQKHTPDGVSFRCLGPPRNHHDLRIHRGR